MNTDRAAPEGNTGWIALTVLLAAFMEVLDTSIANVSLQHIAGSLSVSTDEATWVLTTYLIANAIVIPSTAWFGDRFGRKRFLMTCMAVFTAASFLCGTAGSLPELLVMRLVQGAAGGALQPIAQAILLESFPKEKHGQAMGLYGLGVVLAPIVGPVLGGWITDNYSWRWIFFINVPVGAVALLLMKRFVHDPSWIRNARPRRLDTIGFGLMALWLGCQEVLMDKGQEDDWFGSRFIVLMAVLAGAGLIAFVVRMLKAERPVVDLRVLKHYNFSLGLALMFVAGLTLYGVTAIIPLFLQSLLGYTALQSGWAMLPRGLGALVAMPLAGRLITKVQGRYLVAAGFVSFVIAAAALSRVSLELTPAVLFWPLFISGASIGFMFVPLNTLGLGSLKPEELGNGSGLFNLMRNVGGSAGIAMIGTWAARAAQAHQTVLAAHVTPFDPAFRHQSLMLASALADRGSPLAAQQSIWVIYHTVLRQANLLANLDTFRAFAAIGLVGIVAALLLRKAKVSGPIAAH